MITNYLKPRMRMKMKDYLKTAVGVLLAVLSFVAGGLTGVFMADAAVTSMGGSASPLPGGAGVTVEGAEGGMTVTTGREVTDANDPDFYQRAIDEEIVKMRPMDNPIDTITRKRGRTLKVDSMEVEYYSVETRPMESSVVGEVSAMTSGQTSVTLKVDDASLFSTMDTIRVAGVKGFKEDGIGQSSHDLVLYVVSKAENTGYPVVVAVNGKKNNDGTTTLVPTIPENTKLYRMGRAASEIDVETGNFFNLPTPNLQFCQKFMMQVEQSTWNDIQKKKVNWSFKDVEEQGIYDMRRGMENSFLFGELKKLRRNGGDTYFTGGVYYMAGKHMGLGTGTSGVVTIDDKQMVDLHRELFAGTDSGNRRKYGFAGSKMMAALDKIDSKRFQGVSTFNKFDLDFSEFKSTFGSLEVIYHPLMDLNGKDDEMLILDVGYLTKGVFKPWKRTEYNMNELAKRDTKAVVLSEASCCYLSYPNAHAVVKLGSL